MQVSADQLFSQIGRLQVEKSALEQANETLAQEVMKLRKELEDHKAGEKDHPEEPKKVLSFPESEEAPNEPKKISP